MNVAHSAVSTCSPNSACGKCFNNIIDDRGLVLMLTPKVATQSITQAYNQSRSQTHAKFCSKSAVEEVMLEHLVIGFIRNPFDRLVSCWKDKCVNQYHRTWPMYNIPNNASFSEFVGIVTEIPRERADKHWRLMSYDLITEEGTLIPHYLVRYEDLNESFEHIRKIVSAETGVKLGELPHKHESGKGNYKEYYTQELIDKVAAYYRDDLENFNYGI